MMTLNKELKTRRINMELSQRDLSTMSGVGRSTIAEIESGAIKCPSNSTLYSLFEALAEYEDSQGE